MKVDFKSDDPLTRYLKSARELGDCTIFHSIFKRDAVQNFNWPLYGISRPYFYLNILWHGTLYIVTRQATCVDILTVLIDTRVDATLFR